LDVEPNICGNILAWSIFADVVTCTAKHKETVVCKCILFYSQL